MYEDYPRQSHAKSADGKGQGQGLAVVETIVWLHAIRNNRQSRQRYPTHNAKEG